MVVFISFVNRPKCIHCLLLLKLLCRFLSSKPAMDAMMRTTTAVTVVSGGVKVRSKYHNTAFVYKVKDD